MQEPSALPSHDCGRTKHNDLFEISDRLILFSFISSGEGPINFRYIFPLFMLNSKQFDYILYFSGFTTYLNMVHDIDMPPNQYWFCVLNNTILFASTLCSALLILSMTFDRFYSIIRPHKAASFNTIKRGKITIMCIILFSMLYNIPHLFISSIEGRQCVPYGKGMEHIQGQFYYWLSFVINFALPFVLLLIMNCFIIHTIRRRPKTKGKQPTREQQGQGQSEGQNSKIKKSETQIFVILLLVTFSFLFLTTPAYVFFLYVMFVDYTKTPYSFAGFYLFYNVGQKTYYTNYGINFFLYVISGGKFRTDLMKLFKCKKDKSMDSNNSNSTIV